MPRKRLSRPVGLASAEWESIAAVEARLHHALDEEDFGLVVGCAKELCEAVALVVLAERGFAPAGAIAMPELVSGAHKALEFQPGEGIASDPETRKIAQGLRTIVLGVGELRNRRGTGHGRAHIAVLEEEHADLAASAAMLWVQWALRRLAPYIAGNATALVRDLEDKTWRRGELARRLVEANLARQTVADQSRIGVAVARRASRETFVVIEDGIEAVLPEDSSTWPAKYVEGLIGGLFFDASDNLDLRAWKVRESSRIVSGLRDDAFLLELADRVRRSRMSRHVSTDDEVRREVTVELSKAAADAGDGARRAAWQAILVAVEGDGQDDSA